MGRRGKRAGLGIACAFGVVLSMQGCRTPTEAILDVSFTGSCEAASNIAFIVGTDPVDSEQRIEKGIFTTTADCATGKVGTLVVTPNESTGRAAIVVLAGVGKSGRQCLSSEGYKDCIIARRVFAFVEHTSLTIPIKLDLDCKDVPCDAMSTCENKKCASSSIECTEVGCLPPGQSSDGGTTYVDAPTDPDAYVNTDGAIGVDGNVDPPTDAGPDTNDGSVCENAFNPVSCNRTTGGPTVCASTSHTCCWGFSMGDGGGGDGGPDAMSGASGYDCRTTGCSEQMSQPTIRCNSAQNCAPGSVCCRSTYYGGSTCQAAPCPNVGGPGIDGGPGGGQQFCKDSCECPAGKTCTGTTSFGSPTMQTLQYCQ